MIVVDTNVIASLFLTTEHSTAAEQAVAKDPEWVAPRLWRSEFRNVLATFFRRGRLDLLQALAIMEEAEARLNGGEHDIPSPTVLALATSTGCSAYDCEFVAVAQDLGVLMVTLDEKVQKSFPDIAIPLNKFIAG